MTEAENDFESLESSENAVRPALLASPLTMSEYSLYLRRLLIGLADESISVALICPDESQARPIVSPTVEIIKHPAINLPFMGKVNRNILVEKLKEFKPTVIHCLCESQAALVRQISKQLNVPYLLSINALSRQTSQISISPVRLAKIIAPSETIAAGIGQNYPRLADRVKLIKMGTFVSESAACFSRPGRLASIAAACSVKDKTDFGKLLSAVKRLAIEGRNILTVIIGDYSGEKPLRSIVSALGMSEIVSIVPRKEPWREVLSACDIFIEPHSSNFFNPILLEALSVGDAVAGCKGDASDLIVENQTAAVLEGSDEQNIYNCLRLLIDNPQSARNIAVKAQDFVRKNLTVSEMATATIDCYRQAQI